MESASNSNARAVPDMTLCRASQDGDPRGPRARVGAPPGPRRGRGRVHVPVCLSIDARPFAARSRVERGPSALRFWMRAARLRAPARGCQGESGENPTRSSLPRPAPRGAKRPSPAVQVTVSAPGPVPLGHSGPAAASSSAASRARASHAPLVLVDGLRGSLPDVDGLIRTPETFPRVRRRWPQERRVLAGLQRAPHGAGVAVEVIDCEPRTRGVLISASA